MNPLSTAAGRRGRGFGPASRGYPIPAVALLPALSLLLAPAALHAQTHPFGIPTVDLAAETHRQVVVDREPGQYLGHPTTVLLEDGIVFRVEDPEGKRRLVVFSGLYPIRMAMSEDDGRSWAPLVPIGSFGGIVAMSSVVRLKNGDYMALFHDDGRFLRDAGERSEFRVFKTVSPDGGLTWGEPEVVTRHPEADLCEPGAIRSPDGNTVALLLRENSRKHNSFVVFSNDEGVSWSEPRELPAALTGDRHTAKYGPDGRLFVSFRDMADGSATKGDWVGWVGTFEDIVEGREGQYRVRFMDNKNEWDTGYPGVEVLADGTFVVTTYGHWVEGEEPFVVSVRFTLEELDEKVANGAL